MIRDIYPSFIVDSITFNNQIEWCVRQSGTTPILFRTEDRNKAVALAVLLNEAVRAILDKEV